MEPAQQSSKPPGVKISNSELFDRPTDKLELVGLIDEFNAALHEFLDHSQRMGLKTYGHQSFTDGHHSAGPISRIGWPGNHFASVATAPGSSRCVNKSAKRLSGRETAT